MGHYYVDLACTTCGEIRCKCPRTPPTEKEKEEFRKMWFESFSKLLEESKKLKPS